jgi:5-methylcytosine-specific restriction endonuclease McrA
MQIVPPNAFRQFLRILGTNNSRNERLELAYLSGSVTYELGKDLGRLLDLSSQTRDEIESQVGLLLASRTLWQMVPQRLFDGGDPNYERLASNSFRQRFPGDEEYGSVAALASIYRHLRRAHIYGRTDLSRLDLTLRSHKRILDEQRRRCACCGYLFSDGQLLYNYADPEDFEQPGRQVVDNEVFLETYYRQPVLDHIIPHFIGGDHETNWQILCSSCNLGKGEAVTWLLRAGFMPVRRISEVTKLTPSLRYAAIGKFNASRSGNDPHESEIRVVKKDPLLLITFDNLEAR